MTRIVTICGSMKFQSHIRALAEKLTLENGYIVIQCVYFEENREFSLQELCILRDIHLRKIELSDAIFVVNVGRYIGEFTRREIEFAHSLHKEVLFLESVNED